MLPKDNFYNLILTHRLPVTRGDQSVKEFLNTYFDEYVESFKTALDRTEECSLREECYMLLSKKVPILEELCSDILAVFDYYDSADMKTLYSHFSKMMTKIEPLLVTKNIGNFVPGRYDHIIAYVQEKKTFKELTCFISL